MYIAVLLGVAGILLWHSLSRSRDSGGDSGCYARARPALPEVGTGDELAPADCAGPHDWEVVGVIPSVYESEATAEACAALWSDSEAVYWYGTAGARGTSYCLIPAT